MRTLNLVGLVMISPHPHPPFCAPFTGNPGLKVQLTDGSSEIDFFNLLFDDSMWTWMVDETNQYAESHIVSQTLSADFPD